MAKTYSFSIFSNRLNIHTEPTEETNSVLFSNFLDFLSSRGWNYCKDPNYDFLNIYNGEKNNLRFVSQMNNYSISFDLFFDSDVNFKQRYSFDGSKLQGVDRLIFKNERNRVINFLQQLGYCPKDKESTLDRVQDAISRNEFPSYSYEYKDKDGRILHNGQLKYFRSENGRLQRGVVFYDHNSSWWAVSNQKNISLHQAHDLFDLDGADENSIRKLENTQKRRKAMLLMQCHVIDIDSVDSVSKSVIEKYEIRKKHEWATFYIDELNGGLSIQSSFGEWGFTWGFSSHGCPTFKHFVANDLCKDRDYFLGKILNGRREYFFRDKSFTELKHLVLQYRHEGTLSESEARDAWDAILSEYDNDFEDAHSFYQIFDNHRVSDVLDYEVLSSCICTGFEPSAVHFYDLFMPILQKALLKEISENNQHLQTA